MTDSTHSSLPNPDWMILGELELPVRTNAEGIISSWLTELLAPLNLPADFFGKIFGSAQSAASRALEPDVEMTFGHIHLSIFASREQSSKGNTWGFFRIEKIEDRDENCRNHAVEYYLYSDGSKITASSGHAPINPV